VIRAVIDTNVIVSAFFWGGLPRQVLVEARTNRFRMVTSEELIDELVEDLSRPKFAARLAQIGETVESLLQVDFRALVEAVEPAVIDPVIIADLDDDVLLACSVGGAADFILSGDHHLLDLAVFGKIKIWQVHRFLTEALV
jgi:putative PIN family toxin of toxin-antitoxin system